MDNSQDVSGVSVLSQLQLLLLGDLRRHFEYPLLAKKREWEGTVWLSVTLNSDGTVNNVRVIRSSGYTVLDRSAVTSMQRIGRLTEAARWLNGHGLELPLPIIYRLTN